MFGIILAIGELIGRGAYSLRETCRNEACKKTNITEDGLCYIDMKGRRRLLSNDHVAYLSVNPWTEDTLLIDVKTQRVIKNFSREKRAENRIKNIEIMERYGNTVYYDDENRNYREKGNIPRGVRFYDRETNECYVIREIDRVRWFMRVSDGKIIRMTDRQLTKINQHDPIKTTIEYATEKLREQGKEEDKKLNFKWDSLYDFQEIRYLKREKI